MSTSSLVKLSEVADIKTCRGDKFVIVPGNFWITNTEEFKLLKSFGKKNPKFVFQIIPKSNVNSEFLYLVLSRPLENLNQEDGFGSGVKRLTVVRLKELMIPVLPLDKQEKVLGSKNRTRRIQKIWLDNGIRNYEEKFHVDMEFEDLLKLAMQPLKKK